MANQSSANAAFAAANRVDEPFVQCASSSSPSFSKALPLSKTPAGHQRVRRSFRSTLVVPTIIRARRLSSLRSHRTWEFAIAVTSDHFRSHFPSTSIKEHRSLHLPLLRLPLTPQEHGNSLPPLGQENSRLS